MAIPRSRAIPDSGEREQGIVLHPEPARSLNASAFVRTNLAHRKVGSCGRSFEATEEHVLLRPRRLAGIPEGAVCAPSTASCRSGALTPLRKNFGCDGPRESLWAGSRARGGGGVYALGNGGWQGSEVYGAERYCAEAEESHEMDTYVDLTLGDHYSFSPSASFP